MKSNKNRKYYKHQYGILYLAVLGIVIICSAAIGSANLSILDSLKIIVSKIPVFGDLINISNMKDVYVTIVWKVRMPRIILAGLTGCGLSVVGVTFQGLFKNPLADPHILGVSSGAAVGATVAMLTGIGMNVFGLGVIGIFAFIAALITVFIVYQISCIGNKLSTVNIILTGTAVSTMLSSVISLLMAFHHEQIEKVYLWALGSFSAATWSKVLFVFVFVIFCTGGITVFSKELDIMTTGQEAAESLGVDTARTKKVLIVLASLLVAACVSVSGIIGFVGLVIPHCIRILNGPKHRELIPLSAIAGASFMIVCDTIGRNIAAPTEIPVGVITAAIGTPFFIYLLQHNKRRLVS